MEETIKNETCCKRYGVKIAIAMSFLILCVGVILLIVGYTIKNTINNKVAENIIITSGWIMFGLGVILTIISVSTYCF